MYKIGVIGCGAIGLTTALEIQKRLKEKACVSIFADKFSPDTVSDIAAGLWEPYLIGENEMEDVIRWSKATYDYVLSEWKKEPPKPDIHHRSFIFQVQDVRPMEKALLGLLADFHSGKLRAFEGGCTMERMKNIREQQEKLAKLHFNLDGASKVLSLTDDSLKNSQSTMSQLILRLEQLRQSKQLGISLLPVLNLFNEESDASFPEWMTCTLGYNKLSATHLESLGQQYSMGFSHGFMFVGFIWEASVFLPYFQQIFLKNGGKILKQHIKSFKELKEYDVIVNCSGLEARVLSNDSNLVPIRGQITRVEAPWQYISYLVQLSEKNSCYVIPNINTVIMGGTKQHSFDTRLNNADRENFTENNFKLNPPLRDAKIVGNYVGLRPGRNKIRLEKEYLKDENGSTLTIIHNYGHGGSGITLCIGCARDATDLVEQVLSNNKCKL